MTLLSNLLVPLSLWLVGCPRTICSTWRAVRVPHDAGVAGRRGRPRNTGRVIAFALSLMYLWALDHIPELTGLNRGVGSRAKLVGLWQPGRRAMVPMRASWS